jgi:adenylate kinase family enzyme
MKRVAVFGNAGGGKSTLARQLAVITGLPLHVIDQLQFKEGGAAVPHDEYLKLRRDLLAQQDWIIDGYGDTTTVLERCGVSSSSDLTHSPSPRSGEALRAFSGFHRILISFRSATNTRSICAKTVDKYARRKLRTVLWAF